MEHRRERSLTALVILEAIALFVIAPLSVKTRGAFALEIPVVVAIVACVLAFVWKNRAAVVAVFLATAIELAAVCLRFSRPSASTVALDFIAALMLLVALTVVLGITVFGPGRVTIHRVLGAIAIYLNTAAAFAFAYRIIDALGPDAFTTRGFGAAGHSIPTFIYFSFAALTTNGYGDIAPLDPIARSLTNIEAVIGQLYPATLLARLITLELEHRRSARSDRD